MGRTIPGLLYVNTNQLDKAEAYFTEVAEIITALEGPTTDSLNIVQDQSSTGIYTYRSVKQSIIKYSTTVTRHGIAGDIDPYEKALAYQNSANIYREMGQLDEAFIKIDKAVECLETSTQHHHSWFTAKLTAAELHWKLDQINEVNAILTEVQQHDDIPFQNKVFDQNLTGLVCTSENNFAQAEIHFKCGIRLLERTQHPQPYFWLVMQNNVGRLTADRANRDRR